MGTRSVIAVMHGTNAKAVYCHWDGYLEHNGKILQEHYNSVKANELVSLGDLSCLRPNIGEKHAFSKLDIPQEQREAFEAEHDNSCTFYMRDREETGCEFKTLTDFDKFLEYFNNVGADFAYIMRDGVWYVFDRNDTTLRVLSNELANLESVV
jgi:hypothetical protein